jgi:hypothetical protein
MIRTNEWYTNRQKLMKQNVVRVRQEREMDKMESRLRDARKAGR